MRDELPDVLRVEADGPVRVVVMDRPEHLNAIDEHLHAALNHPDPWVRAATTRAELRAESGAINTGVYTGNRLADEAIFDGGIVAPIEIPQFQTWPDNAYRIGSVQLLDDRAAI